ncbi:MAG TPA: L,D-transpeptidase [Longilinea sp.]|nr:L,D-transpeptidase [Longilinea sp.]
MSANILSRSFLGQLSRREFLKLSGISALSLLWMPYLSPRSAAGNDADSQDAVPTMGRITDNGSNLYDRPSYDGKLIKTYWKDLVFPIDEVTLGDDNPSYNRIWYRINNDEGYIHSGVVQPVEIKLNDPVVDIPTGGRLAEVSVPFTDVILDIKSPNLVIYRLYYGATFWVTGIAADAQGNFWYQIPDDYYNITYYANAKHLRMVSSDEITPISPDVPADAKRIEVLIDQQAIIAYENDTPVYMSRAATGAIWKGGKFSTPEGRHYIDHKRPSRHMTNGSPASAIGYDLPGVPWVSYFTDKGISFHGTYWHNDFGHPRSHGCVNLPCLAAKWVYRWSLPQNPYGVDVVWKASGTRVDVI